MKDFNKITLKGQLYSHDLVYTQSGDAIRGSVSIQTSKDGDIVSSEVFASPVYSRTQKPNRLYSQLEDMISGDMKTVRDNGIEEAAWISLEGNVDISYYMIDGKPEVTRAQKVRGSFMNSNRAGQFANEWKADVILTNIREVEAEPEIGKKAYVVVTGYLVNSYKEDLSEIQLRACSPAAMNYLMGLDLEEPYFVSIWGQFSTAKTQYIVKSAFGEDQVREFETKFWEITGMAEEKYDLHDEMVLGMNNYLNFKKALEEKLEEIKLTGGKKAIAVEKTATPFKKRF